MSLRTTYSLPLLLLLLSLAGCAGLPSAEPTATPAPPTPTSVPLGGHLTIRLDQDAGPLQPWLPRSRGEEQIVDLLYSGLTRLDGELRPQPDLATGWSLDQVGKTITFTLRLDATWHDGERVESDDVAWTIQALRAISPTTTLLADLRRVVTDVQTPDPATLVLKLSEPYAPLLSELSLPVLPRHRLEGRSSEQLASFDFWQEPTGSGPFKLQERRAGEAIILSPHAGFYAGAPHLEQLSFVVAPDVRVARDALESDALLLAELPWEMAGQIAGTQGTSPQRRRGSYPENAYYYLAYNLRPNRLFADPSLRAALAHAIDLPQLVEQVTNGQGLPLGSDLLPGLWPGDGPAPAAYDPERAAALLDEAGWRLAAGDQIRQREGITLTAQLLVRADDERRVAAARRIAEAARAVGMDLQVVPADFDTTLRSKLAPPFDFDLLLMSWVNSRADPGRPSYVAYDPDDFALFHSSQIYQGPADARPGLRNYVAFQDQSFDNQVTAARSLFDLEQRKTIYAQTAEILAQSRPYLFLWADRQAVLLNQRVQSTQGEINLNTPAYLDGIQHWYVVPE